MTDTLATEEASSLAPPGDVPKVTKDQVAQASGCAERPNGQVATSGEIENDLRLLSLEKEE